MQRRRSYLLKKRRFSIFSIILLLRLYCCFYLDLYSGADISILFFIGLYQSSKGKKRKQVSKRGSTSGVTTAKRSAKVLFHPFGCRKINCLEIYIIGIVLFMVKILMVKNYIFYVLGLC